MSSPQRRRGAEQGHHPLDQLLLEAGPLRRLGPGVVRAPGPEGDPRRSRTRAGRREPPRELARASGRAPASARSPGPARRRPASIARPPPGTPSPRPALQGRRRDAGDPAASAEGDRLPRSPADPTGSARPAASSRRSSDGAAGPRRLRAYGPLRRPSAPEAPRGPRRSRPSRRGAISGEDHCWPVANLVESGYADRGAPRQAISCPMPPGREVGLDARR